MKFLKDAIQTLIDYLSWLFQQQGFITALILVGAITLNRILQEHGLPGYVDSSIAVINFFKGLF